MPRRVGPLIFIMTVIVLFFAVVFSVFFLGRAMFIASSQLCDNESTSLQRGDAYLGSVGFDLDGFRRDYSIEALSITSSYDGHEIPADFIRAAEPRLGTAILVHGLGSNRRSCYPAAKVFLENGYDVLSYDQRSSGENTARYTTFGYLESKDLLDWIAHVNNTQKGRIVLWGQSFGGATVGIALGDKLADDVVDFAVLDCPVSEMRWMIQQNSKEQVPPFLMNTAMLAGDAYYKLKLGFSYNDAKVSNYTSATNVPVLIFNSAADDVTPPFMGEDIYNSIPHGNKELISSDSSPHAEMLLNEPDLYIKEMLHFIK